MVVQYQGARARRALGTRAAAPGHLVNMLTDEQLRGSGEGWASALELRRFIRSFTTQQQRAFY